MQYNSNQFIFELWLKNTTIYFYDYLNPLFTLFIIKTIDSQKSVNQRYQQTEYDGDKQTGDRKAIDKTIGN